MNVENAAYEMQGTPDGEPDSSQGFENKLQIRLLRLSGQVRWAWPVHLYCLGTLGYITRMLDCADPFQYCPRELALHVTSYHFERAAGYNENNAGLGVKWRKHGARLFLTVGAFHNSIDQTSSYGGAGGDWSLAGLLKLRITAGLVTGYEISPAPFVFPELLVGDRSGIAVGFTPRIEVGEHVIDSFISLTVFQRF